MSYKKTLKDDSVTIMRTCGMGMIVACHLCTFLEFHFFSQVFMIGVQFFFFISGWLYSYKKIPDTRKWFAKQWIKICVPIYTWQMVMAFWGLGSSYYKDVYDFLKMFFLAVLNLQGLYKIFPITKSVMAFFPGCAHLWFTSVILTCYLLLAFLKSKKASHYNENMFVFILVSAIVLCVTAGVGVCTEWWIIFLLGYYWAKYRTTISVRYYIRLTIVLLFSVAIYLLSWKLIDGTMLYDDVISHLAKNVITLWCFETIRLLNENTTLIEKISNSKFVQAIEKYSYDIYIVHYECLYICFYIIKAPLWIRLSVFALMSCVLATLLHEFSEWMKRKIYGKIYKQGLELQ